MADSRQINFKALILWLLVGAILGWQLNSVISNDSKVANFDITPERAEALDLDLFWDVWGTVGESYYDIATVEEGEEVYGAIRGLVDALGDPYSVFLDPEESTAFHQSLDSELEGVGMELTVREGLLVVVSPLKGTPAERAGLRPGDHVYLVDGNPTSEMTLFEAIMSIRGEPKTQVELTIIREGEAEPLVINVTREKINVPTVQTEFQTVKGEKIAVVKLYQFGDSTTSEFKKAVRDITLNDADAMVLDMRLNGGGYLDVSIEVMGEFFAEKMRGVIVKRRNQENEVVYTDGRGDLAHIPLVVLIDEGSASASEILAGALQDYERGAIMGEQSFGKGSVQELASLRDGSSLRLTVAKWYTPNDRGIDGTGIIPDIEIPMDYELIDSDEDLQLKAALDYLAEL